MSDFQDIDPERAASVLNRSKLRRAVMRRQAIILEGIKIYLNHPSLDDLAWAPTHGWLPGYFAPDMPALDFPWTPRDVRQFWREKEPDEILRLESGDLLFVRTVINDVLPELEAAISDPSERAVKRVYFGIRKKDDQLVAVRRPARYVLPGYLRSYLYEGDHVRFVQSLRERLEAVTGFDLDESWEPQNRLLSNAKLSRFHMMALLAIYDAEKEEDALVAFGYGMAMAEMEESALPLARQRIELRTKQRKVGAKTATQNAAKAHALWRHQLLLRCGELRLKDPSLGQKALVWSIMDEAWYGKLGDEAPEFDTMRAAVRQFETSGKLKRSTKNQKKGG